MIDMKTALISSLVVITFGAKAFELPEHLFIVPLDTPTSEYIDIRDIQDDIVLPDNLILTFQKDVPTNYECREIHVRDIHDKISAFQVCTGEE